MSFIQNLIFLKFCSVKQVKLDYIGQKRIEIMTQRCVKPPLVSTHFYVSLMSRTAGHFHGYCNSSIFSLTLALCVPSTDVEAACFSGDMPSSLCLHVLQSSSCSFSSWRGSRGQEEGVIGIHYGQMIANSASQEAFLITAEWAGELMWAGCGVESRGGARTPSTAERFGGLFTQL